MKKIRMIIVLLSILLLVAGCSNTKDKDTASQNGQGRYVESKIALPDGLDCKLVRLKKKGGMPFLYVFESDLTITGYQLNSDGKWEENTPEWLKSVTLPENSYNQDILEDKNGNHYIYYTDSKFKATLLHSTDDGSFKEIELEGMNQYDSKSDYYGGPTSIKLIGADTIAAIPLGGRELNFYNTQSLKNDKNILSVYCSECILSAVDQSVAVGQMDSNNNVTCIDLYDTSNNYKKTSFPYKTSSNVAASSKSDGFNFIMAGNSFLDINEDKDLILCNNDGVHVLEQGTTLWQTVIDGSYNSMSMFNINKRGFIEASNKNYYVLYQSNDGTYSFMEYFFDKTAAPIGSIELNLYTLTDSSTLQYAASAFQRTHPDVKINFNIAMSEAEYNSSNTSIKADFIRALNTELIAGKGPDLIVLNDLPVKSLINKGVLTDVSDIIKPMVDSEELFPNIMKNYCMDGKYYQIPLRFSLPLLCARTDAKSFQTLSDLAKFALNNENTTLYGALTTNDFYDKLSPSLADAILGADNKINRDNLIMVLNELKAIADNCGIVDGYTKDVGNGDGDPCGFNQLACTIQVCLSPCAGYTDAIFPLGATSKIKGSYVSFENSFIPKCELGINKASKEQALCKEFISTVLSEEVMRVDCLDGFPINKKALSWASQQLDHSGCCIATDGFEMPDGSTELATFMDITPEQKQDLFNLCSSVTKKANNDDQILAAFKECTEELFRGSQTVEETADLIIEKTSIYLYE